MKTDRGLISYIIAVITMIFLGLSFADFYTVITIGSIIDVNGEPFQEISETSNTAFSAVCAVFPLMNFIIPKKWTRVLSIIFSVVNFLFITLIYPMVASVAGMIGATYHVKLTSIGWMGATIVLFTVLLLFFKGKHPQQVQKTKKGGNEE